MGTNFFKGAGRAKMGSTNVNMEARAQRAPEYAGRTASIGAQKDLGAAMGLNHALATSTKRTAAIAPGPKKV